MPSSNRTKKDIVIAFRCSEILEAARKIFAKKGFRGVTVDQIAEAAGLAKGTIYQYFTSKQEIYLAALRQGVAELMEQTRQKVESAKGIRLKLEAFIQTRLNYMEENRDFFGVYHAEFGNITHLAAMNKEFRVLYQRQLRFLESVLQDALQSGEIRSISIETAATVIYEGTRGLMLRRMLGWSNTTVEQDIESLVSILWRGIGSR
jgi:AcrR family transcriptional regulator